MKADYTPLLTDSMGAARLHIHRTTLTGDETRSKYVHSHGAEEVMYLLEGSGEFVIDGRTFTAGAGEIVFFPAGSTHGITRVLSGVMHYLTVRSIEPGDDPCCCEAPGHD